LMSPYRKFICSCTYIKGDANVKCMGKHQDLGHLNRGKRTIVAVQQLRFLPEDLYKEWRFLQTNKFNYSLTEQSSVLLYRVYKKKETFRNQAYC
jgi:hypothetical protein